MTEIDVLSRLPLPLQPWAEIPCDTVLVEELRVARELGRVEGVVRWDSRTFEHCFHGRLTAAGHEHLQALLRRRRGDA